MSSFTIYWLDSAGAPDMNPRPRIIGRDVIKRRDLTDAITAACNMLRAGKGNSDWARGFIVRVSARD